jgi:hypothetical protein
MEDVAYPNNDEMDADDGDDEEDEIEYGDEEMGSDHTSETSQDEDEANDMDVISGASGEPWDADGSSDEEEGEEESIGDEGEDGAEDGAPMWEASVVDHVRFHPYLHRFGQDVQDESDGLNDAMANVIGGELEMAQGTLSTSFIFIACKNHYLADDGGEEDGLVGDVLAM